MTAYLYRCFSFFMILPGELTIPRSDPLHSSSFYPLINPVYSRLEFTGEATVKTCIRLNGPISLLYVGTEYVTGLSDTIRQRKRPMWLPWGQSGVGGATGKSEGRSSSMRLSLFPSLAEASTSNPPFGDCCFSTIKTSKPSDATPSLISCESPLQCLGPGTRQYITLRG